MRTAAGSRCETIRNVDEHAAQHRKVMKARENRAPGRVVRIDLGDGRCAYGRQLLGPSVEFYNRVGKTGEAVDLLDVVASPVAFTIWVMDYAFRRRGGWELLDVVPLTDGERAVVDRRAKQDPISKALSIYQSDPVAGTFGETPATAQECAGLEVAAVWDPKHVEDRLRDHFDGRPNIWVESIRLKT
jgi:Immunity protein 26